MRRIICILFLFATFYLAGIYQLESLMIFFMAEVLVVIIMWFLSRRLSSGLEVSLQIEGDTVGKGEPARGTVTVANRSWLPVLRFRVRIDYDNCREGIGYFQQMESSVAGKGQTQMDFFIASDYCGVLKIGVSSIKVWDYLSLFGKKRSCRENVDLLVMPGWDVRIMDLRPLLPQSNTPGDYSQPDRPGNQPPEIYQIQNYQEGDTMRDIHWKLSARMDQLMSRKYASEKKKMVDFFLDLQGGGQEDIRRMDAFWELAAAISRDLVQWEMIHRVWWRASDSGNMVSQVVERPDEMYSMMKNLLITTGNGRKTSGDGRKSEEIYRIWRPGENVLRLNLQLELYRNEEMVMKFTEEMCRQTM
ncbi:MAG: DUF58 domain-containing protein [Ruminococcus sp.]|jgi:uncharacterized protein (DUF58 family)